MTTTFLNLPIGQLVESKTNARKRFNAQTLAELADSIKTIGILQAPLVRPLPGHRVADTAGMAIKPTHEIVAGHRRYRAAVMAGLQVIGVNVRSITDAEMYKAQSVENLHREGLSELDEGEGYADWMEATGIKAEGIAKEIERSVRYVYDRLRLCKLQPETKAALQDGIIDVSRALLLAPIPDAKLQLKALAFATNKVDEARGVHSPAPSVRELSIWLRQNVMLDLARAPFQITAANLVPLAGSCKSCPKRTGADPDMFSHVDGADICTDPPCYNHKAAAHIAQLQHQADKRGLRLVHGAEAKAACYQNSSTLNGYSPLSQVRNDLASGLQGQRLDALLGHSAAIPLPNAVLIENPFTKELIAAIPTAEAEAALLAKGLVKQLAEPGIKADKAKSKKEFEADIKTLESRVGILTQARFDNLSRAAVVQSIFGAHESANPTLLSSEVLRAFVKQQVEEFDGETALSDSGLLTRGDTDDFTELEVLQATALIMTHSNSECLQAYAVEHKLNTRDIMKQASNQVQAEVAAQIAALKPQKPPAPKSPLAQPPATPLAYAHADVDAKPKTAKPKTKAKLSAEDAQLGIAEAMQGIEAPPADVAVPVLKTVGKLMMGSKVKVVKLNPGIELWREKYLGRTGTITTYNSHGPRTVSFKGRTGGVADFTADELEAVAA